MINNGKMTLEIYKGKTLANTIALEKELALMEYAGVLTALHSSGNGTICKRYDSNCKQYIYITREAGLYKYVYKFEGTIFSNFAENL